MKNEKSLMKFEIKPIAFVKNKRIDPEDDKSQAIISEIVLAEDIISESLIGIEEFSHLEIIYYFHLVEDEKAIAILKHARNDKNLPKMGTFARRSPNRPNRIGLMTVELIERKERSIIVKYLDAIDGTPVLDIKPVVKEFGPKGIIRVPHWIKDAMKDYWKKQN